MTTVMRRKAVSLEVKSADDDGTFKGLGSVFGNVDAYGDVVVRGAFEKSLARHKKRGTMPALLWQHDPKQPIGVYKSMEETDVGLEIEGVFALKTAKGAEAHELTKMKALRGLSIGFTIPKNGAEYDEEKGVYLLKEIDLWEVSVVTFPANEEAFITDVREAFRSGNPPSESEFEAILRDVGFSRTQAKTIVAKGYRGLLREAGVEDPQAELVKGLEAIINTIKGDHNRG